jgi:hypothetical protein
VRRGHAKPVPEALRHVVRAAGDGFELVTHCGHVLRRFETLDEARDFYAWHCPII